MMNIRNLGSKESVGVNFKESICAKFCRKLWFESDCFCFVILLSQDGFERDSPEKGPEQSLPKVTPEAAICRCCSENRYS